MKKTISWWAAALLCLLSAAIVAAVMLKVLDPPKAQAGRGTYSSYAYDVSYQGAYTEGTATNLSLSETGVYYLFSWDWSETERGQYTVDENGIARLTVDPAYHTDDTDDAGFLVPTKGKQFLLLTRDGRSIYMNKIDEGARLP